MRNESSSSPLPNDTPSQAPPLSDPLTLADPLASLSTVGAASEQRSAKPNIKGFIASATRIVGKKNILFRYEERLVYECEATLLFKAMPEVVVLPKTTAHVAALVQACREHAVPFVARGAGTGLSGGTIPINGGALIVLTSMTTIHEIDSVNRTATVDVGVINAHLNSAVFDYGLFYAPDPSSQSACTLGGNIAENAGGIHCLKYGVTADHILALELVTPEGDVLWLGGQHGVVQGIDWVGLIVGSEGTFGIVTQAVVKLTPLPQRTKVYLVSFSSEGQAATCVSDIMASGLQPAAMEFMDAFTVQSVNKAFQVGFPQEADALLLIELDGTPMMVELQEKKLLSLLNQHKPLQIDEAEDEYERKRLWQSRKLAVASYGQYMPSFYLHDCVIPRGELATILEKIKAIAKHHDVLIGNVFHAGDGNLHPNILFNPRDEALLERALAAGDDVIKACLEVGGVLSGEHGIGIEKQAYMAQQFNADTLDVMFALKRVFDPQGLSNPSKILPQRSGCKEHKGSLSSPGALSAGTSQLATGELWV
jgi:glycolate oxidase